MRKRWTAEQAWLWYDRQPWLVGCNFIPSTASNQLEMWQAETFDLKTIERELGWASDIGFNAARVFLHDLLWRDDAAGFLERVDRFLDIADAHGIRPLFVFFDGCWDPEPIAGPQKPPRRHVHNSRWLQSPGRAILSDPARHGELESYVRGVVERHRGDERVLGWDLFNEPDNPDTAYGEQSFTEKGERATQLLRRAFEWARAEAPSQPLTAGVWHGRVDDRAPEINRLMLEQSDLVSFHSYFGPPRVGRYIEQLERYERPLLLTEYLFRGAGNTFEALLPVLKERKIAAFNWGFVASKTQTQYPWDSWTKAYDAEPEPWFHDVLRPDGTPYRDEEVSLIRRLTRSPSR